MSTHAVIASASVIALCVANRMSPIVIQAVLILAVIVRVYLQAAYPRELMSERFDPQEPDAMPYRDYLQYHVKADDNKLTSVGKAEGAFVLQGETASSQVVGPPSHLCSVGGDFTIFVTLLGRAPINRSNVFRVYGSAPFEGEQVMIQVQMLMDPQPDGSVDVTASVGPCAVSVKRPQGSDQVSYVFQRTAQSLTLTAFTPTASGLVDANEPCTIKVEPTVSTPMTINSPDESVGALVEFGIYSRALPASEMNALVMELKRRALLTNPIVSAMADRERASATAMRNMVNENPWESEKIAEQCSAIKDWTKPNFAVASDECRASIAHHCQIHPKTSGCECWDQDSATYKRPSCVIQRELFGETPQVVEPPAPEPTQVITTASELPPAFLPKPMTWLDTLLG